MSNASPGWYPAGNQLRWWDGTQWTSHTQPMPANAAADFPVEPGTIWRAVGKPLTGVGAGKYRLTEDFLCFEKGMLRTSAQQIPVEEIFDVDMSQSLSQKTRAVGTITVHVRRAGAVEIVLLEDVPTFREGVRLINETARKRREYLVARGNTQTINYGITAPGMFAGAPQPGAAPRPADEDPYAQLERLGKLRDAGVLTPEEFERKKAELLARI
jgi:hypothetical protein